MLGCTLDHVNEPISLMQLRFGEQLIDLLPGERAEGGGLDHFCLSIRCADLGRVRDELRARGVTVDGDVVERRGAFGTGPSLYLQDPDGYLIELKPRGASADSKRQQRADDLRGGDRAALGRRLEQAPLGGAHDDRRHGAGVEARAEGAGADAFRQDVLEGEAELLALPGEPQAELLVVLGAHPALEEQPREVGVALAVGTEEDLEGALELHRGAPRSSPRAPAPRRWAARAAPPDWPPATLAGGAGGAATGGGMGAGTEIARRRRGRDRTRRRGGAARLALLHFRAGQFPEDTNWKDSTWTRNRRSLPGADMRISNGRAAARRHHPGDEGAAAAHHAAALVEPLGNDHDTRSGRVVGRVSHFAEDRARASRRPSSVVKHTLSRDEDWGVKVWACGRGETPGRTTDRSVSRARRVTRTSRLRSD